MKKREKNGKDGQSSGLKKLLADPRVDTNKVKKPKKKMSPLYKGVMFIFLIVVIAVSVFIIRSFGAGSQAFNSGMEAYQTGDYNQAVLKLTEAVSHDKGNKTYQMNLGLAQVRNGQTDQAITLFQSLEASTRGDERRKALRGLGIAYSYAGNYAEAVSVLSEALEGISGKYSETDLDAAYYLADAQNRNGDPVGAVLTYTEIIKQKPDANAYMLRGMAYQVVGDNTNAEADLKKAIDTSKQGYKVYMALYQVLMEQGKTDDATDLLEEAVTLGTNSAEDYSNRGLVYMYLQQYDQAEADMNTAIEQGYAPGYFAKAKLMMTKGSYEEAVANFSNYIDQSRDNALAYNEYGICLMHLGRYAEATGVFATGLALNDMTLNQEIMMNEVIAYERAGDWVTALSKITAYVEKYPDDQAGQKELVFIQSRQY